MLVREVMSRNPRTVRTDQSVGDATTIMAELNVGFLPVRDAGDKLVGTVTDRDIALRVVSVRKDFSTPVRDVMTRGVKCCYEDSDLFNVAQEMAIRKLRRLAVLNHDKRMVGVVTLGDLAQHEIGAAAWAVAGVSVPGAPNC